MTTPPGRPPRHRMNPVAVVLWLVAAVLTLFCRACFRVWHWVLDPVDRRRQRRAREWLREQQRRATMTALCRRLSSPRRRGRS